MIPILAMQSSAAPHPDTTTIVFFAEILLMLVLGRLLGEFMRLIGQPEVLGQLFTGIILGPTIFGNLLPNAHRLLFPDTPESKQMIDAISQLGILMLLLLAGMEIDFTIVRKRKRTALFSSLSGIVLPFASGLILGALLPASLLPAPGKRLVTALFLATALSISSIKIVAMVLMEVDFMRRNIGQLILASAIIDDTIGWIIVALISGIATEGALNLKGVGFTVGGTIAFLALSYAFGPTFITYVIRWTNDNFRIEFPVLSAILALMCLLAIVTDLIGVHTVLGAFVAGILVGQSPMMTEHIQEQLRGLVVGLFAPIFFAVAGLSVDVAVLRDPSKLELAVGLILIASFGKLLGCFVGGRLGGLTAPEAVALATGMNARGTTEVIVATIGLSIGVLNRDFYTLIVVMAVTTTTIMPPMLRWALRRIPPSGEEKARLEREEAEAKDFVPKIERLLIAADGSKCGRLAAMLGGFFAGTRKILVTALDLDRSANDTSDEARDSRLQQRIKLAIDASSEKENAKKNSEAEAESKSPPPAQLNARTSTEEPGNAILNELKNGYDMIFVGLEGALSHNLRNPNVFSSSIEQIIREFKRALAISVVKNGVEPVSAEQMNILVPATGTDYSRRAAEVAIAIAKAGKAQMTAINVSRPPSVALVARGEKKHLKPARELLIDIQKMGEREGVGVKTVVVTRRDAETSIVSQIKKGNHNLVILGANLRPGEGLFFGHSVKLLLERISCSVLVVVS
jgi:K+:H+ antiporter